MTRSLLSLLFCLLLAAGSYAKNEEGRGIIAGRVTTSDGQPAIAVTITLKGTQRSTITNEQGNFILRGVAEGAHELEVSLTGYETITREVEVEKERTVRLSIQLAVSEKQLEEVIVSSHHLGLDPYQSFTSNDLSMKNPRYTMQGEMRYKFNDQWTSQTAISRGTAQSRGYYGYIFGTVCVTDGYSAWITLTKM